MAAQEGHVDVVRTLLTKGANQQCTTEVSDQPSFSQNYLTLLMRKSPCKFYITDYSVCTCRKKTALYFMCMPAV